MKTWPKMSIQLRVRFGKRVGDDVDADVLVALQRVGGGEQEHRAEQIPLQLQPGVGADVEGLADDGVAGADQDGGQDQPGDRAADERAVTRSIAPLSFRSAVTNVLPVVAAAAQAARRPAFRSTSPFVGAAPYCTSARPLPDGGEPRGWPRVRKNGSCG